MIYNALLTDYCKPSLLSLSLANYQCLGFSGLAVRRNFVPVFEDIFQYLDYLKLDEAIIGLDYLDQLSWSDLQSGPRYSCRLCSHQISNLQDIVLHVIGRKHRQKYMETKRPELLTRNKQFILTQSGKAIRARAEIIERQDGRGTPVIIVKKGIDGKSNISRVPPRQEHNRGRNTPQSSMLRVVPSHRPGPKDHQDKYAHTRKPPAGYPNPPPFPPGDPRISNRDRPMYQEEDSLRHGRMEEELRRADFRQSEMYRRECMDPDFRVEYENNYPQRRGAREPVGGLRYDSMEEMLHHQHVEHYAEEAPPYRRPPPERDQLKEFYTEEVRRRQGHAEYQPSQQVYQEGHEQRRSLERESGRNNGMNRAGREGSWEQEAKRRVRPTPMESGRSHDHLFNTIIDYCHDMGEPHRVETEGPSRTGPDTSQRRMEAAGAFSEIPEPFMRFLTGAANDVGHNKRKRKSRFSDATVEEVETTNEMFNNDYGPPNPKFGGHPSHFRPETHQHPDSNIESQSPQYTEGYQRGGTESSNVFDMLKNIDIENAEEADFLKDKLCNLLKDFKNKKSAKVVQNSHGRGSISQDYNCLNPGRELSPRHQYDTPLREDSDMRRPHNLFFQEHHRGRGWQQHEPILTSRLKNTTILYMRNLGGQAEAAMKRSLDCPGHL
ncbi:uncharacterized protein si:ch211-13c6.2 isoform X2 [Eleginops maclovinus]|uniref:uncharacterized protein si:ch211-13c6.2 isoform X2 n=1 Tax=Eleginops maclovinus TaxID=56733 RepID=UPI003080A6D8